MADPPHIVIGLVKKHASEVVNIGTLSISDCSEHPFPGHVQKPEFLIAITAILKLHAVPLSLFSCADQLPAFLKSNSRRHLNGNVLSTAHGFKRHLGMVFPGCEY